VVEVRGPGGAFVTIPIRMVKTDKGTVFRADGPELGVEIEDESIDKVRKDAEAAAREGFSIAWRPPQILIAVDKYRAGYDVRIDEFGLTFRFDIVQCGLMPNGDRVWRELESFDDDDGEGRSVDRRDPETGKDKRADSWGGPETAVAALIDGTPKNLKKCRELCNRLRALYDCLATELDQSPDDFGALGFSSILKLKPIEKTWDEKLAEEDDG
jgi:hypothetical protein